MMDHRSHTHNLSSCSCEIKAWKKFRPEPGIWTQVVYGLSYIHLYWSSFTTVGARGFFSQLEVTESVSDKATNASHEAARKKVLQTHKMTSSKMAW